MTAIREAKEETGLDIEIDMHEAVDLIPDLEEMTMKRYYHLRDHLVFTHRMVKWKAFYLIGKDTTIQRFWGRGMCKK